MASRPNKTAAKRYNRVAQALAKDLLVVFVAGKNNGAVSVWDRKRGRVIKPSHAMAVSLTDGAYPWMIHCVVTGHRQDGQMYGNIWYVAPPHQVTQSQIAKDCNEKHKEMMAKFNGMHRLTAAWIGSPTGEMLDEREVESIITKCGAFDFKAQWEIVS